MSLMSNVMQKVVMRNSRNMRWFFTNMKPSFFEKKAIQKAIDTANYTISNTNAYKDKYYDKIRNSEDFEKLPIIDKKSYIKKNELGDLIGSESLSSAYAISTSSGTTGNPTYWPRDSKQDEIIPLFMELLLEPILNYKERSTLVVVTLSMGLWSAGDLATTAMRKLAASAENHLTVTAPGLNIKNTLDLINNVGRKYDQILLIGYPPFVRDLIDSTEVQWKEHDTKIVLGGEGIGEDWRDYILEKIGSKDPSHIINLYATADAGIVGFESDLAIKLRRLAQESKYFRDKLFGGQEEVDFVQYNPMAKYLEIVDDEVILTSSGYLPLVRYNIHDRGRILSYSQVIEILENASDEDKVIVEKYNLDLDNALKLPFLAILGRSDGLQFYSVNLYKEHLMSVLDDEDLSKYLTGKFQLLVKNSKKMQQVLYINVELKEGVKQSKKQIERISTHIQNELRKRNSEYDELCKYLTKETKRDYMPKISFFEYEAKGIFDKYEIKHNYY